MSSQPLRCEDIADVLRLHLGSPQRALERYGINNSLPAIDNPTFYTQAIERNAIFCFLRARFMVSLGMAALLKFMAISLFLHCQYFSMAYQISQTS